jgi:GT2 family glycosyltransferase
VRGSDEVRSARGTRGEEKAMKLPLVYVVVLNWNRKDDTIECVASLMAMDYPSFRIVVVDNGSEDGSVEALKAKFPALEVIVNDKNLGYAVGNNVGICHALQQGASYVFLLNNDTVVRQNLVAELVKVGEADPQVGVLAPKIYFYGSRDRIWSAGPKRRIVSIALGKQNRIYDKQREVKDATGCALLVKKEVFKEVGMFDPVYFMYQEDNDFSKRVREGGYKIIYVPSAEMWHKVSASTQGDPWTKWYHQAKSTVHFHRKNVGVWYLILPIFLLWVIMREILLGNWRAIKPYVVGILDGLGDERSPCA